MKKIFSVLLVIILTIVGLWQLSGSRNYQIAGELISRVNTHERLIALTFDDGPTKKHTDSVLAMLAEHDVPATFFVTGKEVDIFPDEARKIMAAGHQLGNHSWSHPRMVLKSPAFIAEEIEKTDAALRAIGYQENILFRPPYGKKLFVLPWYLQKTGRTSVTWDIEPETWPDVAKSAQTIAEHVIENARPGSIILLHVMYDSREESRKALPSIINGLKEQGYTFVTVSDLIENRTQ